MKLLELDPRELNPLSMELVGSLKDVLTDSGVISAIDRVRGWRRYQLLRFSCGSDAYARMIRLQLLVSNEIRYSITPAGARDELYLEGFVPPGAPLELRIIRAPQVDVAALPEPFPEIDVRAEVFG